MAVETKDEKTKVFDPLREPPEDEIPELLTSKDIGVIEWETPSAFLFEKIGVDPLIRFIGEKLLTGCLQIIVVIDDEPEELVDRIFSIEQEMYSKFKKMHFDLRLRVIPKEENIEAIKKNTLGYYDRDKFQYIP